MNILMEKYVGIKPECALLEKEIGKLRALCKKNLSVNDKKFDLKSVNNSTEIKRIRILLAKLFKCKEVVLTVDPDISNGAFTICKSFIGLTSTVNKNNKGELSAPDLTIYTMVTYGLLDNDLLTDGEILAILLHEMGHNFYNSPYNYLSRMTVEMPVLHLSIALAYDIIDMQKGVFKLRERISNLKSSIPNYIKVTTRIKKLMSVVMDIVPSTLNFIPIKFKVRNTRIKISNPLNPFVSLFNYNVEKHADSVAVDYGYGEELARALAKLDFDPRRFRYTLENNNSPIGMVYQLDGLFASHMSSILSGYPTNQNRVKTALNRIEHSLEDPNLNPKMKKELEGQYKSFKKWYEEEYISVSDDDRRKVSNFYRQKAEEKVGGFFDLREIFALSDPKLDPLS